MKIFKLSEIIFFLKKKNIKKKNIILCHGVFDVLHLGHINYFEYAKSLNNNKENFLIVSTTADKFIKKGFGRPYFNQISRMKFLSNLELVDAVVLSENYSAEEIIKKVKPGYYVKGPDYKNLKSDKTGKINKEKAITEKYGGKLIFTSGITYSSSKIINQNNYIFNEEQKKVIDDLKKSFSYEDISLMLKKFSNISANIIGEIIFDEYYFGEVLGKSGKEPHLVFKENSSECYLGGSLAVARHLSSFVKKINLISFLGKEKKYLEIIKKNLEKNINLIKFFPNKNFSSIVKKRFIDEVSNYKLFGSYLIPHRDFKFLDDLIEKRIDKKIKNKDLLIITDYGHGLISKFFAKKIVKTFKFICLNAQLNSSSIGTHNLMKYGKVDLLLINEGELRHELRDDTTDIASLAKSFFSTGFCQNLVITRGSKGAFLIDKKNFYECPAFSSQSIDKVGAGDAMLSIISICLKNNIDKRLALFLGCLAGAFSVQNLGNKKSINVDYIDNYLEYAFK